MALIVMQQRSRLQADQKQILYYAKVQESRSCMILYGPLDRGQQSALSGNYQLPILHVNVNRTKNAAAKCKSACFIREESYGVRCARLQCDAAVKVVTDHEPMRFVSFIHNVYHDSLSLLDVNNRPWGCK